jgi:CheY-like chemotaxis protein
MLPIALERRKKSTSSTLGRGAAGAEDQVPAAADDVPKPLMGPQETVSLPAPGGEPWVLVVDEDPGIQMQVGSALREWGFHVVGCRSGDAGLKAISRGLPAAAIVDLLLPNLDGFSFIARLQDIPSARGVPIVVWTNLDLEKHEMDALLRDVRQVISKRDGGFERLIHELRQVLWEFQVEAIGP